MKNQYLAEIGHTAMMVKLTIQNIITSDAIILLDTSKFKKSLHSLDSGLQVY